MENKVLANVGGMAVTQTEVEEMIAAFMQRGQNLDNPQGRKMILEQLIANKLFLLDAQKNMYEYSADFKAQMKKIKEDMLINYAMTKVVEAVKPVTDEEAEKFYEENKDNFTKGESVDASHILVDSEDKAKELLEKINARENSSCPSGQNGGSLGEFTQGQMVPEFDEAVFKMETGEITGPVKTQFGYHLIKLNAKNEAKTYSFEEVKAQISDIALKEKRQKAVQSKINQLKIMYPVDAM